MRSGDWLDVLVCLGILSGMFVVPAVALCMWQDWWRRREKTGNAAWDFAGKKNSAADWLD